MSDKVREALQSLRDMEFQVVSPFNDYMDKVVENADECGITVYDSAFLTLAELMDGRLVTSDKELVDEEFPGRQVLLKDISKLGGIE